MATPGDSSPSYPPDGHAAAEPTAALPDDLRDVSVGPLMTAEDPFMASADLSWPNQFFITSDHSPSPSPSPSPAPSPSPPTPANLLPYRPDLEDISDDEDSTSSPARKRSRSGIPQATDTTTQVTPNSSPDMDVPTVPPATPAPPTPCLNPATPYTPYTPAALPSVGPPPGTSAADPSPRSPRSPINSANFRSVYSSNSGPSADFEGFITMEEYMEKRNAIENERWRKPKDKRVAKQHLCDRKQREKKTQAHSVLNQVGDALVNVLALRSDYARDPLMDHLIRLMDPYFSRHYGQDRTIRNEAAKLDSP